MCLVSLDARKDYHYHLSTLFTNRIFIPYFHESQYHLYLAQVPKEEEALTEWLYTRYVEKEKILQEYYDTGIFPEAPTPHAPGFPVEKVPRLNGIQVVHDPLEFVLRHCFYLASSYIWVNIIAWIFSWILSQLW